MAHLRSLSDPKAIHPLDLRGEEFVVGRHPDCNLVIDAASISRRHAAFTFDGSDYYIQDLESRNFTYLNGVKIDPKGPPQKLKDEDKVAFCEWSMFSAPRIRRHPRAASCLWMTTSSRAIRRSCRRSACRPGTAPCN